MLWNIRLDHLSVCLSICPKSVLWRNSWLDPDAVWGGELDRTCYGCIRFWWWCWRGRGIFGSEFGASHCNEWGICCIVVWICVQRSSCRLAWWVGLPQALMGVHVPQGNGLFLAFFGICAPIHLKGWNDVLFAKKSIWLMCEKLTIFIIFPYRQYIVGVCFIGFLMI